MVAGILLSGYALNEYAPDTRFDMVSFAIGLYFIGKGLFIHSILTLARDIKGNKP